MFKQYLTLRNVAVAILLIALFCVFVMWVSNAFQKKKPKQPVEPPCAQDGTGACGSVDEEIDETTYVPETVKSLRDDADNYPLDISSRDLPARYISHSTEVGSKGGFQGSLAPK